ncbi:hypothetical protein Q5752_000562 [Cryptotrichosporon argae]
MLFSLLSRLVCTTATFLYPAYASYKALSGRPDLDPAAAAQVERWLQYWAVVGSWTAIEALVGWTFTWLPFYTLVKALVFIYLSFPTSSGAAYLYRAALAPFFSEHERDIDAFLASLRTRAGAAATDVVGWLWERARTQFAAVLPTQPDGRAAPAGPSAPPPTLADPTSGTAQQLYGLLSHYASRYLPVAVSAMTAAAASATGRDGARGSGARGIEVDTMPMPVPHPYAHPPAESRTLAHARGAAHAPASASTTARAPQVAATYRALAHTPSEESVHSRASSVSGTGSGSGSSSGPPSRVPSGYRTATQAGSTPAAAWGVASGYDEIGRDELDGVDVDAAAAHARPIAARRESSGWFGWGSGGGGGSAKPKSD